MGLAWSGVRNLHPTSLTPADADQDIRVRRTCDHRAGRRSSPSRYGPDDPNAPSRWPIPVVWNARAGVPPTSFATFPPNPLPTPNDQTWPESSNRADRDGSTPEAYDAPVLDDVTIWQGDSRELIGRLPTPASTSSAPTRRTTWAAIRPATSRWPGGRTSTTTSPTGTRSPSTPRNGSRRSAACLKPTGTVFAFTSYNLLGRWHEVFDPAFDTFQFIVWHKTNPPPKLRRAGFLNSCELIVCLLGPRPHVELRPAAGHAQLHRGADLRRQRACPRPGPPDTEAARVVRRLLELASGPGDLVLDPFMGVGIDGCRGGRDGPAVRRDRDRRGLRGRRGAAARGRTAEGGRRGLTVSNPAPCYAMEVPRDHRRGEERRFN